MMDVMQSVELGAAFGKSSDPDPRMEFPKFSREELDTFKTTVAADKGLMELETVQHPRL